MSKRLPPLIKRTIVEQQPAPVYYSLFKKEFGKDGRWVRCRTTAFTVKLTVKIFGPFLASDPYNYHIKAVELDYSQVNVKGNKYFGKVTYKQFDKVADSNFQHCKESEFKL